MIVWLASAPPGLPKPDPAPLARSAPLVTWDYGFEVWFRGRRYWVYVPHDGRRQAVDESGRHL